MKREVAVTPFDNCNKTRFYCALYREKGLFWWSKWRTIVSKDRNQIFSYQNARLLADQALANGVVPGIYDSECFAIVEWDEE
jgi:hypothetical protein